MMLFLQILISSIFINKIYLRAIAYLKYEFTCVNNFPNYIISSEDKYKANNDKNYDGDEFFIFKFNEIHHDIEKELCLSWRNKGGIGYFAFYYASINEYDITILNDYYYYYYCKDCKVDGKKKFLVQKDFPYCPLTTMQTTSSPATNTFCLKPMKNIDEFYISDKKINKKFYKGNTLIYILNNE